MTGHFFYQHGVSRPRDRHINDQGDLEWGRCRNLQIRMGARCYPKGHGHNQWHRLLAFEPPLDGIDTFRIYDCLNEAIPPELLNPDL